MLRRVLPSVVAVSFASCLLAAPLFELPPDKSPKSAAAREALGKFQEAEKQAKATFAEAMSAAKAQVIKDLEAARAEATKSNDKDEANRIAALLADFKAAGGGGEESNEKALRAALTGPGVIFKRFGKSSNVTLKADGTVWEGSNKTPIKWEIAASDRKAFVTFTEPSRACRFVPYEGNTYVGVYPDGSPAALTHK